MVISVCVNVLVLYMLIFKNLLVMTAEASLDVSGSNVRRKQNKWSYSSSNSH